MKTTSSIVTLLVSSLAMANAINLEYFASPDIALYPLQQCQGACSSDAHCGYNLVCMDADAGSTVPGCEGTAGGDQSFCVPGDNSGTNGAAVAGVSVTPSTAGTTVAGAEQEDSSAGSLSLAVGAGVASAVMFGLF